MEIKKLSELENKEEMDKCKNNPYYYYTHYCIVNGKPATTNLAEEAFNELFTKLYRIYK